MTTLKCRACQTLHHDEGIPKECKACSSKKFHVYCKKCDQWRAFNRYITYIHSCDRVLRRRILKQKMKDKKKRIKKRINILTSATDPYGYIEIINDK